MRKGLSASLLSLALIVPACSGGGAGTYVVPQPAASVALAAPKATPVPDELCQQTKTRGVVHAANDSNCGPPPGQQTVGDGMGDTISGGSGVYEIDGSPLADGGFDSDLLDADFGTYSEDDGNFVWFAQIEGYPPMSNPCQEALSNLNAGFLAWVLGMAAVVVPAGKAALFGAKVTFGAKLGIGATAIGGVGGLSAAQQAVNLECAGQGAGQNPMGALPPDYQPGT